MERDAVSTRSPEFLVCSMMGRKRMKMSVGVELKLKIRT